jgi:hypothetical protein
VPGQFSFTQSVSALANAWPLDVALALMTSQPTDTSPGNEYTAQGYNRTNVRRTTLPVPAPPAHYENLDAAAFGPFGPLGVGATIRWIVAFAPVSHPIFPNQMVMYWELDDPKTPLSGDSLLVDIGALAMDLE